MADFYPLLARAVSSLPERTPQARRAVYERARTVLMNQLRALDPPLTQGEIARQRLALEEVIRRVENEQAGVAEEPTWADRADDEDGHAPASTEAGEAAPPVEAPSSASGRRPKLGPAGRDDRGRRKQGLLAAGVLALLIASLGGLAYWTNKVKRPDLPAPVIPGAPAPTGTDDKFNERLGGEPAPLPRPAPPPPPAAAEPAQPAIPVAQRAILYEETPEAAQTPKAVPGRVVWRLDSSNPGQGQKLETVVRADIEVPDAGLTLSMVLRRNTDASLPASHTIELTFGRTGTGETRQIRDVGVPQFKAEESARGVPLSGLPVPVTDNVFLIGLSNVPADIERNLDLLRARPWIDLPIRYANGRRAVLAFDKGVSGEQAISEALNIWQKS